MRSVRRARQKTKQYGENVEGILPAEEAALTRALYASLQEQKKSPNKAEQCEPQLATTAVIADEPKPSTSFYHYTHASSTSSDSSSGSYYSGDIYQTTPLKRLKVEPSTPNKEQDSPISFAFGESSDSNNYGFGGVDSFFSSPLSSPGSIGSSLRLVLSTSSWTSSSSSSHYSPAPTSPSSVSSVDSATAFLTTSKATQKKRKGKRNSTKGKLPKGKLTVNQSLFSGESPRVSKQDKGKAQIRASPKEKQIPSGKFSKSHKSSSSKLLYKANPDVYDRLYGASLSSDAQELSSTKEEGHIEGSHPSQGSPSSCVFTAQRKFAHCHLPAHSKRFSIEEPQSLQNTKEVPKTEDFITFLCLRGSNNMPKSLQKFTSPWTPQSKKKRMRPRSSSSLGNSGKVGKSRLGAAKKLEFLSSSSYMASL